MLFKDYHIYPMHLGIKTYTRRFWKYSHVTVGKIYPVTHKMIYKPEDIVGTIYVEEVYRQPLGMMTPEDAYKEGAYDLPAYKKVLDSISKKDTTNLDSPFVVKFQFALSYLIDEHELRDVYFIKWKEHMIKLGLNLWTR